MSKSSLNFIYYLLLISQQYSKINRQLNLTDFKKYFFLQQISHVKQYCSEKWQLTMAMIPCTEYYGQPEYFLFSFFVFLLPVKSMYSVKMKKRETMK